MLREGWNFHGDIAIPLESIASQHYRYEHGRPLTKIYDASAIEAGSFVEVMVMLLRDQTEMDNSHNEIDAFITECTPYFNRNGNEFPREEAQRLFNRFMGLYEQP